MKFYSVSRLLLLGLTISFLFSVIISGIVFASSSENWVEVARFTGSDIFTTDYFTCNHVEWRIRWEIGGGRWPGFTNFSVTTFPQGEASDYVDLLNEKPEKGNGTHYIHDNAGTFYMKIVPGYIDKKLGYTIIVE